MRIDEAEWSIVKGCKDLAKLMPILLLLLLLKTLRYSLRRMRRRIEGNLYE
jgi:hypothetical protein